MTEKFVYTKELFEAIKRAYPDSTLSELSLMIGIDKSGSGLSKKKKQTVMSYETADKWLTALGLEHLFYTGELRFTDKAPRPNRAWKSRALFAEAFIAEHGLDAVYRETATELQ